MTNSNAKPVSESKTEMVQIVLPNDTNHFGNVLGGTVMHWIDLVAAIAAGRHCRLPVVTASMDRLDFISPVEQGDICILKASVNRTWRTSMEIGVKVFSEDPVQGDQHHTSTAYLTFVALSDAGKPTSVPPVRPETAEEKRRFQEAGERREERLRHRTKKKG